MQVAVSAHEDTKEIVSDNTVLTSIKAGDNVSKADSGHGDEAKVECIKECDIFRDTEEVGTNTQEADENKKTSNSSSYIASKTNVFLILIVPEIKR